MSQGTTHPAFAPGSIIGGKYRVDQEIAAGGMGVVVLCTHLELGQAVALKYLQPRMLGDAPVVERFKREARLAATLRSDNVVRVHDVGTVEDGTPYMVMEWLEGEDLGKVIERGPVSFVLAREWIVQACEGLDEAHARRIVHRDLKPENLFLAKRGSRTIVKVVDFGISKVNDERERRITTDEDRFGTPDYMSPEQLRSSGDVDARTDIWALGVVLYELLTGASPFPGDSVPSLISSILIGDPTPLALRRPDLSPEVGAVIGACLARDPAARPETAIALADRLCEIPPLVDRENTGVGSLNVRIIATPPSEFRPTAVTLAAVPAIAAASPAGIRAALPLDRALGLGMAALAVAGVIVGLLFARTPAAAAVPETRLVVHAATADVPPAALATPELLPLPSSSSIAPPPPPPTTTTTTTTTTEKKRLPPAPRASASPPARKPAEALSGDYAAFGGRR